MGIISFSIEVASLTEEVESMDAGDSGTFVVILDKLSPFNQCYNSSLDCLADDELINGL